MVPSELGDTNEPATVVLAPLTPYHTRSHGMSLVESRWLVRHVLKEPCGMRARHAAVLTKSLNGRITCPDFCNKICTLVT